MSDETLMTFAVLVQVPVRDATAEKLAEAQQTTMAAIRQAAPAPIIVDPLVAFDGLVVTDISRAWVEGDDAAHIEFDHGPVRLGQERLG